MLLSADTQNWLKAGLCEAVMLLCKSVLKFESQFSVEGLLAVTIDKNEVFLVNIKEIVDAENKNNGIETQSNGNTTKLKKRSANDKVVSSSNRSNGRVEEVGRSEQRRKEDNDESAYNSGNIQAVTPVCDNTASNNIFNKLINEEGAKEENIGVLMMDLSNIKTEVGFNDLVVKNDYSFNNSFDNKTFHSELYHPRKIIKQKQQRREARAGCCENCGTTNTTTWRRSNDKQLLCNACGCYYKLHGVHRPAYMAHNEIRSRTRKVKKSSQSSMFLEKAYDMDLMLRQQKQQRNQQSAQVIKIQPQQDFQQHNSQDVKQFQQCQKNQQQNEQQFQQKEDFLHEYQAQNNYQQQQNDYEQQQQNDYQQQQNINYEEEEEQQQQQNINYEVQQQNNYQQNEYEEQQGNIAESCEDNKDFGGLMMKVDKGHAL